MAEFNARCRESVMRYIDDWNRLTERIGHWIDTDDAYVTLDNDYIESVWWSLRQVFDRACSPRPQGGAMLHVWHGPVLAGGACGYRRWSTHPCT